jgi:NAD dependent epimerase/dehydratase
LSEVDSKRALVTGGGGFIGSHLVEALLADGWHVRALVHYNSRSSWGWLEGMRGRAEGLLDVVPGDVVDPYQADRLVVGTDTVFHLAALIGIPFSYTAPALYYQTNALGTLHLAQAAIAHKVRRFIHISTSEVYGTARYTPIDEGHPLQAQSPYSASKIAADKLVESFYATYGLPAVTVRPFNTFGPRQSARAVIPTIITQLLDGSTVRLGAMEPVRDFTFVTDTVQGMVAAADAENVVGRTMNLGCGSGISIADLVAAIAGLMGKECRTETAEERLRPKQSEVGQLISDNSLARTLTGWKPVVPLVEGLQFTVDWIRSHREAYPPEGYTV